MTTTVTIRACLTVPSTTVVHEGDKAFYLPPVSGGKVACTVVGAGPDRNVVVRITATKDRRYRRGETLTVPTSNVSPRDGWMRTSPTREVRPGHVCFAWSTCDHRPN